MSKSNYMGVFYALLQAELWENEQDSGNSI